MIKKSFYIVLISVVAMGVLDSCKAKSCDASSGTSEVKGSKKPRKNMGLMSKKERRRRRW